MFKRNLKITLHRKLLVLLITIATFVSSGCIVTTSSGSEDVSNLTAHRTSNSTEVELRWSNPQSSLFTGVSISWEPNGRTTSASKDQNTIKIGNLSIDVDYTFTVKSLYDFGPDSDGVSVRFRP